MAPQWVTIGGACLLPHLGGFVGAFITRSQVKTWYEEIKKPSWRPPNWAFGPVWTTLFTSMGYASYLIWRDGGGFDGEARLPLALYGANLALNWAWTPLFFGAHKLGLACIEIGCLWSTVAGCIYMFFPINKLAAGLMVPYLGWVTLASALNYTIWQMNKTDDKSD